MLCVAQDNRIADIAVLEFGGSREVEVIPSPTAIAVGENGAQERLVILQ